MIDPLLWLGAITRIRIQIDFAKIVHRCQQVGCGRGGAGVYVSAVIACGGGRRGGHIRRVPHAKRVERQSAAVCFEAELAYLLHLGELLARGRLPHQYLIIARVAHQIFAVRRPVQVRDERRVAVAFADARVLEAGLADRINVDAVVARATCQVEAIRRVLDAFDLLGAFDLRIYAFAFAQIEHHPFGFGETDGRFKNIKKLIFLRRHCL